MITVIFSFCRQVKMAVGGTPASNIVQNFLTIINFVKKHRKPVASGTNNLIIRMHYQWTFWLLVLIYAIYNYAWYNKDDLICVNTFDADKQVRIDYLNICLTYLFVPQPNGDRRYLFFYRYFHWIMLGVAGLYYLPRKFSKHYDDRRVMNLFNDIVRKNYGNIQDARSMCAQTVKYMRFYLGSHNRLYFNNLLCSLLALAVDIISFWVIDYTLHGRFINYGVMSIPFKRDPMYYTDYMSQTFPPFVQCEISPMNKLSGKRTEVLGCHLTLMEVYEKLFMFLWFWMIFLTAATAYYIVFLCFFRHPYFRNYILRRGSQTMLTKEEGDLREKIAIIANTCNTGDVFFLYQIKQYMEQHYFYLLLCHLAEPKLNEVVVAPRSEPENLRNRTLDKQDGVPMTNADSAAYPMLLARTGNGLIRRN